MAVLAAAVRGRPGERRSTLVLCGDGECTVSLGDDLFLYDPLYREAALSQRGVAVEHGAVAPAQMLHGSPYQTRILDVVAERWAGVRWTCARPGVIAGWWNGVMVALVSAVRLDEETE